MKNFKVIIALIALITASNAKPMTGAEKIRAARTQVTPVTQVAPVQAPSTAPAVPEPLPQSYDIFYDENSGTLKENGVEEFVEIIRKKYPSVNNVKLIATSYNDAIALLKTVNSKKNLDPNLTTRLMFIINNYVMGRKEVEGQMGKKLEGVVAPQKPLSTLPQKQIVSPKVIQPVQEKLPQQSLQATAKTKIAPLLPKKPIAEQPSPMPKKLPAEPISTSKIPIQSTELTPEKPAIELTPLGRYKIATLRFPSTFYSTNRLQPEWFVEAIKLAQIVNPGTIYTVVPELAQELRDELSKNGKMPKDISNDDIFAMTLKGVQSALQEEQQPPVKPTQPKTKQAKVSAPIEKKKVAPIPKQKPTQPKTKPAKVLAPLEPKTLELYKIATLRNPSTFYQESPIPGLQREWFIKAIKIAIEDPASNKVVGPMIYIMVSKLAEELRDELSKKGEMSKDISNDDIFAMTVDVPLLPPV